MKNFVVKLRVVEIYQMDVEAENKIDAEEVAIEEYNSGNTDNDMPDVTISIDSCEHLHSTKDN